MLSKKNSMEVQRSRLLVKYLYLLALPGFLALFLGETAFAQFGNNPFGTDSGDAVGPPVDAPILPFVQESYNRELQSAQSALSSAKAKGDNAKIGEALREIVRVYRVNDQRQKLDKAYKELLDFDAKVGDKQFAFDLEEKAGDTRDPREAYKIYEQALAAARSPRTRSVPAEQQALRLMAFAQDHSFANKTAAEDLYKQAIAAAEAGFGKDSSDVGWEIGSLTDFYVRDHRYAEAEPWASRAYEIELHTLLPGRVPVATQHLAEIYGALGKYTLAEPLYKRLLELQTNKRSADYIRNSNALAWILDKVGKHDEAEKLYKQNQEIYDALGPNFEGKINLAAHYHLMGQNAGAAKLFEECIAIKDKVPRDFARPSYPAVLKSYANLLRHSGNEAKAAEIDKLAGETKWMMQGSGGALSNTYWYPPIGQIK
jgi:tetratricopeptide (TPR) repeat protein